uniref:Uncharacterized protein n=1 Tax=Tanacetum cinerariifolium TaxID=118510 RepID=A0A699K0L3_TANCI|nr:hypothetical protein [Tanacetum cinerariifolium]
MKIPAWMISEATKHTKHYRMYMEVFEIDVPLTQSQPTESTQVMYRTPIAPRSLKPKMDAVESSAPKRSTVIRFCIPQWRSTRLTPPDPVPTMDKADEMILQDTLQVSLTEYKSREEQEARENVELVNEHLASVEIKKMAEGQEIDDSSIPKNDEHNILGTRKSFGTLDDHLQEVMVESLPNMVDKHVKEQVKKQVPEHVRDQVPIYVAKGLILESQKNKEAMEKMIAKAILQELRSYMSGHILHVHPAQSQTTSVLELQYQLYISMKDDPRTSAVRPRHQDDPHDDAHPEAENSAKWQKRSEYETYVSGESSSGQDNEKEQDDDEIPTEQVSQDIMEEVSLTIDEAKLKKIADDMLRQRCTS